MHVVNVPVSEAVKKFIEKDNQHFIVNHEDDGAAIYVTKRHYLGNIIAMNICSNAELEDEDLYNLPIAKNNRLTFLVHGNYPKVMISVQKITMISRHMELEFKKGFVSWIRIYTRINAKSTVSEAIREFYKHYDLSEDECPLLTLRHYYDNHLLGKRAV